MRILALLRSLVRSHVVDRWLPKGEGGAVMSEYVVLVGVVGISIATAIAALGPPLYTGFVRARGILFAPFP